MSKSNAAFIMHISGSKKLTPKKAAFLIISLCCLAYMLAYQINKAYQSAKPSAQAGILDLRSWDFSKEGAITLKGQWQFFWNEFIYPAEFSVLKTGIDVKYISSPSSWNSAVSHPLYNPATGYATFRLKILLPQYENRLSIHIPTIGSAYTCYINGKKAAAAGITGISRKNSKPAYLPQIIYLPVEKENLDIVFHVSNYHYYSGGLWQPIEIGLPEQISSIRESDSALEFFIIGMLIILFLYHISLLSVSRSLRISLYFAAVCLLISLRVLVKDETTIARLVPIINYDWIIKIDYLTLSLILPLLFYFTSFYYPLEAPRKFITAAYWSSLLFIVLTLFSNTIVISSASYVFLVFAIICCFIIIYSLIKAVINEREGSRIVLTGAVLSFITIINDILLSHYHFDSVSMSNTGLMIFILSQSVSLARFYAKTHSLNHNLTMQLTSLNQSLEDRVHERTSELEKANFKLKEVDIQKSVFFANISHELRTPLTLILSPVEMAIRGNNEDIISNKRFLDGIYRNGRDLLALINNLLELAKIDAGKLTIKISPVNIIDLLREQVESLWGTATSKNISLNITAPDTDIIIFCDKEIIERVFINILINAVKFTGNSGVIQIVIQDNEDFVKIIIIDNGPGIPSDMAHHIFDRFNTAFDNSTAGSRGSGVGLSIAKEYTEIHSGSIAVASRHITLHPMDHGTEFTITLPKGFSHFPDYRFIAETPQKPRANDHRHIYASPKKDATVLLVEDNDELRELIITALGNDFTIESSSNGRDGLSKALIIKPDCIITDMMMPIMNGSDMIHELRQIRGYHCPVLFLSAHADKSNLPIEILSEKDEYLVKPFNFSDLIQSVQRLLGAKS